jgi:UDP-N-acetylmuramoyl-L-alanyl-D-glutamate--2,6-diaminopimelate ligase
MQLKELIADIQLERQIGNLAQEVRGLACHTGDVGRGFVYFALPGYANDGHHFAAQAVAQGATVLVCQRLLPLPVTQLVVLDPRRIMAQMAARWFGNPSKQFALVGVTGTNGKTTITYMQEAILAKTGFRTGLIGSIQYRMPGKTVPSGNTTPDSLTLQGLFREMTDGGCKAVVMEVSSHALDQERVTGAAFDLAILSNLTRDHLEYHQSFTAYREAKAKLFAQVGGWLRLQFSTLMILTGNSLPPHLLRAP